MRRGQRDSTSGTRDTSARGTAGARPTDSYQRYHWHRSDARNRPAPATPSSRGPGPDQRRDGGVEQRRQREAERRGEPRRARQPEDSEGPSHSRTTGSSAESMPGYELNGGMGPVRGTGRRPGAAPWPENIPNGRQPVWAVPAKDWLILLPNTVEPMEVAPQEEAEEPMEVEPPRPHETWDYPGNSLVCAIRELRQLCRRARRAPYSSSLRLRPKH